MSEEIKVQNNALAPTGSHLYAIVRRPADSYPWQVSTSGFVIEVDADWATYAVNMTEQGSTGYFYADFPSGIQVAGSYPTVVYKRSGGSPAVSDTAVASGSIAWDGSAEIDETEGDDLTTVGYVKIELGITNTDTDARIAQIISNASASVVKFLQYNPKLTDYTEVRNGQGANYIRLWQTPVTAIDSVTFNNDTTSPTTLDGTQFIWDGYSGIVKAKQGAPVGGFAEGFQNIAIAYSAGYATVPLPIQRAVALIVAIEMYKNTMDSMGVVEQSIRDVKIKYDDPSTVDLSNPQFSDAVLLLKQYEHIRY